MDDRMREEMKAMLSGGFPAPKTDEAESQEGTEGEEEKTESAKGSAGSGEQESASQEEKQETASESAAEETAEDREEPAESDTPGKSTGEEELVEDEDDLSALRKALNENVQVAKARQEDDTKTGEAEKPVELLEISEDEYEEAMRSYDSYVALQKKQLDYVNKQVENRIENIYRGLGPIIQQQAARTAALMESAREFYRRNPDLKAYSQLVTHVSNEVMASAKEETTLDEVLRETEDRVRKQLRLARKEEKKGTVVETSKRPPLPKRSTQPASERTLSTKQSEIAEMMKATRR